ncbi:hypothetical protein QPL79_00515 [Ignisphaera sp. 4213-co]|uniref:Lrp/AsnC family transcriptional regulator n=1 Tax=Ignisphaera cupida TaxID=3050454 RepID=A0ABD4Z684_9CREN|nr:hypothetical protein [Ignisphaera sp. 4213-co]MDK6027850.1 hypothetical protein [Ignisphaera sp. 4213-co]
MDNLSDVERIVYDIIKKETESVGGIWQRKLKEMPELRNIKPRTLQHIVKKLIKLKLVKRIKIENNGKTAYFLKAVTEGDEGANKALDLLQQELFEIPCITCRYLSVCGIDKIHEPSKCIILTKYLFSKAMNTKTK